MKEGEQADVTEAKDQTEIVPGKFTLQAKRLQNIVGVLAVVNDDVVFETTKAGDMKAAYTGPAHFDAIRLEMPKALFRKVRTDQGSVLLGSAKSISNYLRFVEPDSLVEVAWDKVKTVFRSTEGTTLAMLSAPPGGCGKEFKMEWDLPGKFTIDGKSFLRVAKYADSESEHLGLQFKGSGKRRNVEVQINGEGIQFVHVIAKGAVIQGKKNPASLFPVNYLVDILQVLKGNELEVEIGTDFPLRIRTVLGEKPGIPLTYALAPRIESK